MTVKEKLAKMLEPRFIKYRKIMTVQPHCPVCKEHLFGNGSFMSPYTCSCGEWEIIDSNYDKGFNGYRIKTKAL